MKFLFQVNIDHLQAIHYFYLCLALFSFASALFFFATSVMFSFFLIILYVFNSILSWYIALFIRKKLQNVLILTSPWYVIGYIIITILVTTFSIFFWSSNLKNIEYIAVQTISVGYFIFCFGILWTILTNIKIVRNYFIESTTAQWRVILKPVEMIEMKEIEKTKAVRAVDDAETIIENISDEKIFEKAQQELDIAKNELNSKNYINAYVFAIVAKKIAQKAHMD
jgi:hypothetical protein